MDGFRKSNFSHGPSAPSDDFDDDKFPEEPELEQRSRLEYLNSVNPRKKKRAWLWLLIGLIIIGLLGGGAYAYLKFVKEPADTAKKQAAAVQTKPAVTKPEPTEVATSHHDSSFFNLGFDYPEKWAVVDNGDGKIIVSSPASKLKTAAGQQEYIQTVMTIAAKGQNLAAFDKGNGQAVRDSEKIKYSNPTSVQRAETYITFTQYATASTTTAGIDAVIVTGDFGYLKNQYVPKVDMVKLDPVIAVTFLKCADTKCTTVPAPASVAPSNWDSVAFKLPIETMLKSISVN